MKPFIKATINAPVGNTAIRAVISSRVIVLFTGGEAELYPEL